MQKLDFTLEEQEFLLNLYQRLTIAELAQIESLKNTYLNPGEDKLQVNLRVRDSLTALAENAGIHPYSMHLLFLLLCAPELPKRYRERGYDEKLAYDLLYDLRIKLTECERCSQIIGAQAFTWFHGHFLVRRFALGYFQYDYHQWELDTDYHFGDIHLTKGDPLYKIHIPSKGKMTREKRLESYRAAHDFFGYKKGEPIALYCSTWFLYEGYRECFPEGSNLRDFRDDFDVVQDLETEGFPDAWRIFNCDFVGDTSGLPRDTTLQRKFIEYIENGGKFGLGRGVILYDGERIINNFRDH